MLEADVARATADRMMKVATDLKATAEGRSGGFSGHMDIRAGEMSESSSSSSSSSSGGDSDATKLPAGRTERLKVISGAASSIGADYCAGCCSQMAKLAIFNPNNALKRREYIANVRASSSVQKQAA